MIIRSSVLKVIEFKFKGPIPLNTPLFSPTACPMAKRNVTLLTLQNKAFAENLGIPILSLLSD